MSWKFNARKIVRVGLMPHVASVNYFFRPAVIIVAGHSRFQCEFSQSAGKIIKALA